MRTIVSAWIVVASLLVGGARAQADTRGEIIDTYLGFARAQNDHAIDRIGAYFVDTPDFLWVSDGMSFWGREAVLERMGDFQKAEHWRVLPGLDHSKVIDLGGGAAILHMPLRLEIGRAATPDALDFLVSVVFRRVDAQWRIAALLTTSRK